VRRFLQDLAVPVRPLFPRRDRPAPAATHDEIARCRDLLVASAPAYRDALQRIDQALARGRLAARAGEFLGAGVKIRHATFGLRDATAAAARDAESDAEVAAAGAARGLEPIEEACLRRYEIACELLSVPAVGGASGDADPALAEMKRAQDALRALEGVWPDVLRVGDDREMVAQLAASSRGAAFEKKVAPRIDAAARRLAESLTKLRQRLDAPYPFAGAAPVPTIGEWAIDPAAGGDVRTVAVERAGRALVRLFELLQRLHGRLATAAERAEASAGFPPLPDPAAGAPSGPVPAAARTSHF